MLHFLCSCSYLLAFFLYLPTFIDIFAYNQQLSFLTHPVCRAYALYLYHFSLLFPSFSGA